MKFQKVEFVTDEVGFYVLPMLGFSWVRGEKRLWFGWAWWLWTIYFDN